MKLPSTTDFENISSKLDNGILTITIPINEPDIFKKTIEIK